MLDSIGRLDFFKNDKDGRFCKKTYRYIVKKSIWILNAFQQNSKSTQNKKRINFITA